MTDGETHEPAEPAEPAEPPGEPAPPGAAAAPEVPPPPPPAPPAPPPPPQPPAQSAAQSPMPPPAPPASPSTRWRPITIGPGQILVVLGAVAVTVSMFLNWLDFTVSVLGVSRSASASAADVPFAFLFDDTTRSTDPSLLIVLVPVVVLVLADVVVFRHRIVTFLAAAVTIVTVGLYSYQLDQTTSRISDASRNILNPSVFDLLGVGAYLAFAGALAMLVGALLTRPASRAPAQAPTGDVDSAARHYPPRLPAAPQPRIDAPPPQASIGPPPVEEPLDAPPPGEEPDSTNPS